VDMDDIKVLAPQYGSHWRHQKGRQCNPGDRASRGYSDRSAHRDDIFVATDGAIARKGGDYADIMSHLLELFVEIGDMDGYSTGMGIIIGADKGDLHFDNLLLKFFNMPRTKNPPLLRCCLMICNSPISK